MSHNQIQFEFSQDQILSTKGDPVLGGIPSKYFRSVYDNISREYLYQQKIEYICVFETECNLPNTNEIKDEIAFNEIIELSVIIIQADTRQIIGSFHTYVRPEAHLSLTAYTKKMTGLTD